MDQKSFKKVNFYFDFYEKRVVPDIYWTLYFEDAADPIYINTSNQSKEKKAKCQWYVKLFPSYFTFQRNNGQPLQLKKIFRVKGFAIAINNLNGVDHYLRAQFKPNFRTSLRRRLKGLEACFNVQYRMYYGHIGLKEYEFLMQSLHTMLIRRFEQRNDENEALNRWNDYYGSTFSMINKQKASLYVIYDDLRPIQISLSYHHDKIMFLAIPSYDIDYAKFGLGNLSIAKLLEWCIENNYVMLDMGYGAFDYKVKWCNETYDFEHHLFYKKSSIISQIIVYYITLKTRLINYLLDKNINVLYHQIKDFLLGKKKSPLIDYVITENLDDIKEMSSLIKVNPINDSSFRFLRKALYDFAYKYLENVSNIEVFELEANKAYYLRTADRIQKIVLSKSNKR